MQVLAVSPDRYADHSHLLREMHRLRCLVFRQRLGWDVSITDGAEEDEYDSLGPTYILTVTDEERVVGCARLLPAMGPTMLERTFSQLLATGSMNASSQMVESSRFCVDTSLPAGRGEGQLHFATLTMFAGIIEWSMANGYDEIVTATDLRFERILNRAGWPMQRLGEPATIGNTIAIAGSLPANRESFERVCPQGYHFAAAEDHNLRVRSAA
ncbi:MULTISPECIES: acyl-homoserine-lactone synthase TraI [Agrobacterium]|uniref:Acyl-homoserine-lactone synthase n=1 Tax=Agrobacterium burrii TaxID=2815339 RepID=A0ABS3EJH8_9HYPH|nr:MULTISPECIES: acyl-homoserine-lactone synthase TraI [Agrobacterium]MBO0132112.1 GNAT family N-acetyltransferase [Agrobacterium burrii]